MAKTESNDFQELFGASTIPESLDSDVPVIYKKPEPKLPMDDPMFQFQNPTGAGAAICQRAEDRDFIAEISGFSETEVEKTLTPLRSTSWTA